MGYPQGGNFAQVCQQAKGKGESVSRVALNLSARAMCRKEDLFPHTVSHAGEGRSVEYWRDNLRQIGLATSLNHSNS
jgi:hypothetical protein